jgi:hypothetical protein
MNWLAGKARKKSLFLSFSWPFPVISGCFLMNLLVNPVQLLA